MLNIFRGGWTFFRGGLAPSSPSLATSLCTAIQDRLQSVKVDDKHHEKVFVRLMLQGKVSAALRWVGSQRTSLLQVDDEILQTLKANVSFNTIPKSRHYETP